MHSAKGEHQSRLFMLEDQKLLEHNLGPKPSRSVDSTYNKISNGFIVNLKSCRLLLCSSFLNGLAIADARNFDVYVPLSTSYSIIDSPDLNVKDLPKF